MPKRALSSDASSSLHKRPYTIRSAFAPPRIASQKAADAVSANPPLDQLLSILGRGVTHAGKGECVVYWMRLGDLRIHDNRALSRASEKAVTDDVPLVVIFVLSPQDYIAHDRGARRIDFTLRNLSSIKASLAALNIPLHTAIHSPRVTLPSRIISLLKSFGALHLFANFEYELDELRRDITVCNLAKEDGMQVHLFHDRCVVEPGPIKTGEGRTYTVYSPYLKQWAPKINGSISHYLEECRFPHANDSAVRESSTLGPLFDTPVPDLLEGFGLSENEKATMTEIWPAGEDHAKEILNRFLHTKSRSSQLGAVNPLASGVDASPKNSRIMEYNEKRDRTDRDTTSRLSPYLSAGVISARECARSTMRLLGVQKIDAGKTGSGSGVARWIQEIAWRDFYTNILASFPRVSMGRPFHEKYANVVWEIPGASAPDADSKATESHPEVGGNLQKWKDGKTGYPIVDAGMRCAREMGWMHNRTRMICAMFLCKHLMIDWREGERYFMQILIDGDLASNNGGWQWSASTGTDEAPYFRIFNPYIQSAKADPTGEFIRHWVPELAKLKGQDVHHPPEKVADKLGYPRPIVKHEEARQRALRRYKSPGEA